MTLGSPINPKARPSIAPSTNARTLSSGKPTVLIALLVCLIPTTIGGLLSAIGIAGMDRLVRFNVIATSGRAVEAAGDVDTLLLDKTGTITFGNRMATEFLPVSGVRPEDLAAAALASIPAPTPPGQMQPAKRLNIGTIPPRGVIEVIYPLSVLGFTGASVLLETALSSMNNGLHFPGNEDNCIGHWLAFFEDDLVWRAVNPPGKAGQPQKLSLVDGAERDAIELVFFFAENDRSPLQNRCHNANRIDGHESQTPKDRWPECFGLEVVIRQYEAFADQRQNAQHEDVSC